MASLGAFAELTGELRSAYDYRLLLNTAPDAVPAVSCLGRLTEC